VEVNQSLRRSSPLVVETLGTTDTGVCTPVAPQPAAASPERGSELGDAKEQKPTEKPRGAFSRQTQSSSTAASRPSQIQSSSTAASRPSRPRGFTVQLKCHELCKKIEKLDMDTDRGQGVEDDRDETGAEREEEQKSVDSMIGRWKYGSKPTVYQITQDGEGQLCWKGSLNRSNVQLPCAGVLEPFRPAGEGPEDSWFLVELRTTADDEHVGTLRLCFDAKNEQITSNFKPPNGPTWGRDITADRLHGEDVPVSEIAQALEDGQRSRPHREGGVGGASLETGQATTELAIEAVAKSVELLQPPGLPCAASTAAAAPQTGSGEGPVVAPPPLGTPQALECPSPEHLTAAPGTGGSEVGTRPQAALEAPADEQAQPEASCAEPASRGTAGHSVSTPALAVGHSSDPARKPEAFTVLDAISQQPKTLETSSTSQATRATGTPMRVGLETSSAQSTKSVIQGHPPEDSGAQDVAVCPCLVEVPAADAAAGPNKESGWRTDEETEAEVLIRNGAEIKRTMAQQRSLAEKEVQTDLPAPLLKQSIVRPRDVHVQTEAALQVLLVEREVQTERRHPVVVEREVQTERRLPIVVERGVQTEERSPPSDAERGVQTETREHHAPTPTGRGPHDGGEPEDPDVIEVNVTVSLMVPASATIRQVKQAFVQKLGQRKGASKIQFLRQAGSELSVCADQDGIDLRHGIFAEGVHIATGDAAEAGEPRLDGPTEHSTKHSP